MLHKMSNRTRVTLASTLSLSLCAMAGVATANPEGAQVMAGVASSEVKGNTLNVTASNGAIIDWKSFGIDSGEATRITLDSAAGRILNRVTGGTRSDINGQLSSNGTVFLINTNGIVVGNGALVDTNGLVLSGLDLTNENFSSGNYAFSGGNGSVVNAGTIGGSKRDGSVALLGASVSNSGTIRTSSGDVLLAAGQKIKLASVGASNVYIELAGADNKVVNTGSIDAANLIAMLAPSVTNTGTTNGAQLVIDDDGNLEITGGGGTTEEPDGSTGEGSGGNSDSPVVDDNPEDPVVREPLPDDQAQRPDPNDSFTPETPSGGGVPPVVVDPRDPESDPVVLITDTPQVPSYIVDDGELLASLLEENTLEIVRLQESLESEEQEIHAAADDSATRPDSSPSRTDDELLVCN